ncbi:hypothetical protein FDG2_3381 [Candidatus Protofrankia californiensis]|uniref:DUF309 domain-containing protein n=1 Tax=Candidatus Protofrankia californiensis TaxID=1839754 RepID=A0A1C3NZM6_9ACTN|nr:hypothetical protein FDG2_3381 [Candidatus Protofrankia californiensis]
MGRLEAGAYGEDVEGKPGLRDRDVRGRARNARPRDALGRPLGYGETGVDPLPVDLVVPPVEALAWAQHLIESGRPFQAHEVLEAVWKVAPDGQRELWRGLAQFAVGLTHLARGNDVGAAALFRRSADHLVPYAAAPPHGVNAAGLSRWAAMLADEIERAAANDRSQMAAVGASVILAVSDGCVDPGVRDGRRAAFQEARVGCGLAAG